MSQVPWHSLPATTSQLTYTPPPPPPPSNPPPPPPPRQPNGEPMRKRSRFSANETKSFIPGIPQLIPKNLPRDAMDALLLRARIDEITFSLNSGKLGLDDESVRRSPSPPPRYDAKGKRTNTREQRVRDKLSLERQDLISYAMKLNPTFKPPGDYRPQAIKKTARVSIPVDKYPDYNFIGLIIGPRGDTHKQLERKSGAKISIRGKGSQKEGQTAKNPDDDEPLHVLITADTQKQLDIAVAEVEKLLIPVADEHNEHKQYQLAKLAEYNGTLRSGTWRNNEPKRFTEVVCSFCGEPSHPTADCPMKKIPGAKSKLDLEYEAFMSLIGEPKEDSSKNALVDEFMASLGVGCKPSPTSFAPPLTPTYVASTPAPQNTDPASQAPSNGTYAPPPSYYPPPPSIPPAASSLPWQSMSPWQPAGYYYQ